VSLSNDFAAPVGAPIVDDDEKSTSKADEVFMSLLLKATDDRATQRCPFFLLVSFENKVDFDFKFLIL
jgi:hypothetical protein